MVKKHLEYGEGIGDIERSIAVHFRSDKEHFFTLIEDPIAIRICAAIC